MSFQSFAHFLGFYLNGKMVYTRVHADWASGAEVALAWRLRGARVDDDVAWLLTGSAGSFLGRWIKIQRSTALPTESVKSYTTSASTRAPRSLHASATSAPETQSACTRV